MTDVEQTAEGSSAGYGSGEILDALARGGRWLDASNFYCRVDAPQALVQARLFLAAGRLTEAHALLIALPEGEPSWFERTVDEVLHGDLHALPDLVVVGSKPTTRTILSMLMMRAAHAGGRADLAAHYAKQVLAAFPGDTDAACVLALEAIGRGDYLAAVGVLDRVENEQAADGPTPLQKTLAELDDTRRASQIAALVTIGHFTHREKDPTRPATQLQRDARARWHAAYRAALPQARTTQLIQWGLLVLGLAATLAIPNVLPVILATLGVAAWGRRRSLPGLDAGMTSVARRIYDPLTAWKARNYRVSDGLTALVVVIPAALLVASLPHTPLRVDYVKVLAVILLVAGVTRARRRWVRRDRRRLINDDVDLVACRCRSVEVYRGRVNRPYVTAHLVPVGPVPGAPSDAEGWRFMECLSTQTRYLDLPKAEMTIRLGA